MKTVYFLLLSFSSANAFHQSVLRSVTTSLHQSSVTDSDFANFAATLEEPKAQTPAPTSWQEDLEELLSTSTTLARRQILTSKLVNSNAEIRASVQKALRDRKLDPILTPTARRLQDNTRIVARQLASDILKPPTSLFPPPLPFPTPADVQKATSQIFSAVTKEIMEDPARIPQRLQQQPAELFSQLLNETPDLSEPPYTVVASTNDYEIRDYASYQVVGTQMADVGDELSQRTTAFQSLVSYLLGGNVESKVMDMTTPVTTTRSEMRFYLADDAQLPLPSDSKLFLQTIPAARLAVRRFPGFCTAPEVDRQKETLLAALAADDYEHGFVKADHGEPVPHIVLEYNPPFALPVIRRNEVAVVLEEKEVIENWN